MKRRLSLTAIVVLMNNVLTPFSYAFTDETDVLGVDENVVVEEVVETPVEETLEEEDVDEEASIEEEAQAQEESPVEEGEGDEEAQAGSGLDSQLAEGTSANVSEGQTGDTQNDVNNNPGSESMTGQDSNSEQNENGVEPGLNSEAQTGNTQTGSGLDSSVNTLEGQTGDVESLTGDIKDSSLNSEGGNIQTGSALSGDAQSLSGYKSGIDIIEETIENNPITGDVLTGDVESLTGEILTGEIFTGDVMTGSAIDTLNTALEEIVAQREAEIAKIRETLNEEVISGQEMYKDVIVNVEAPAGSFPSVAELRITPITTQAQQQQIKDQLVENTDVTEESELVSFDISFIYTLSGGEVVELQPYTGQTVKVSFNFTYNDTLSQADNDSEKELKVYHLEEVKDEKGKKTEEVEVKEIEINNEESSEGELVVDAEKFSVYSVAAVDTPMLRAVTAVNYTPESCFTYELTDDGLGLNITDYDDGCTSDVVIPPYMTYNGVEYPVLWLSYYTDYNPSQTQYTHEGAFYNKGLTSVVLPETLQIIGRYSFRDNNLTSVVIPDSVLQIDPGAFNINNFPCDDAIIYGRKSGVEDRTTIVSFGGQNCAVTIPEGVKTITDRAFYSAGVTSLTLPSTIESIGALAFYINSIRSVTIPSGVDTLYVGQTAFRKTQNSTSNVTCNKQNSSTQVLPMVYSNSNYGYGTYFSCVAAPSDYIVIFDSNGGSAVANQNFSNNSSTVTIPTSPTRMGYRFDHWYYYNSNNNQTTFTTQNTFSNLFGSSVRVGYMYATWLVNTYTIVFSGGAGSVGSVSPISAVYDRLYSAPDNGFSKEGYAFNGWNTDINGNGTTYRPWNDLINLTGTHQATVTLYAQWEKTNTVTFNSNGGSSVEPQYVVSGSTATQPDNPTLSMHSFEGWFSDPELTVLFDFSTPITHNITLYAKWEERSSLLVTFNSNGGTNIPSQEVGYGEKVIKPTDPTKNNQIFMYWTTDSAGNNEYDFDSVVTEDLELYAKREDKCTVNLANGYCYRGTNQSTKCTFSINPTTVEVACGTPIKRPVDPTSPITISNRQYYVSKWSTRENPGYNNTSYNYNFETPVTNTSPGTIYLIGYNTYFTVTFNANGGTLSGPSSTQVGQYTNSSRFSETVYGGYVNEPQQPTRPGYNFKWWSETQNNGSEFNFNTTEIKEDTTLYAQWTPITYIVRYNANGGMGSMGDSEFTYGGNGYLDVNTFTKTNAQFNGWNTKADGSGTPYSNRQQVSTLATTQGAIVNLYAQWTCNTNFHDDGNGNCVPDARTVTFNINPSGYGSVSVSENSLSANYGTQISISGNTVTIGGTTVTATPTAATSQYTYIFSNWNNTCGSTLTDNCTITANFTRTTNAYTVIWKNEDGTVLETDTNVVYGTTPTYNGSTPTKPRTAQYTYTFDKWTPTIAAVTGNITYTATYKSTVNEYRVNVVSNNTNSGTVDKSSVTVPYGTGITINGNKVTIGSTTVTANPKTDTAQWDFEFVDWTNTCGNTVTTGCSITANFKSTLRSYTVTWKNENGTVLERDNNVEYGTTPSYDGATPTKAKTDEFTYTFAGWSPAISTVTGDITYTATYTSDTNKYLITFKNRDGSTLKSTEVEYGTMPVAPANPSRPDTAEFTYSFSGWNPTISSVTKAQVYTATYTSTVNNYKVIIKSNNTASGNVNSNEVTVPYGTSITFPTANTVKIGNNTITATPKTDTAQWDYEFVDWTNTCGNSVSTGCTITANFKSTLRSYTVIWKNYDGTTLETDENVVYGTTATYDGETPTKPRTAQYTYTFKGWDPAISEVHGDQEYTAQFDSEVNNYTVNVVPNNTNSGSVDKSSVEVPYGTGITINGNKVTIGSTTVTATPKTDTAQWDYEFVDWTNTCGESVTTGCSITANFKSTLRSYTVTWKNENGTTLKTDNNVVYGTTPTYDGATPTKAATTQYSYTFAGWSPEVSTVTGNITYTATYTSTTNKYLITFKNRDGTELQSNEVEYGTNPTAPANPSRAADNTYTYTFKSWTPSIHAVSGAQVYTATYDPHYIDYTITWKDYNGTQLSGATYHYNDDLVVLANPSRAADNTYTYEFAGWTPSLQNKVTGNKTYTATYTPKYIDYTITFVNWDNSEISSRTYHYGDTVTVPADPTKPADEQYTYRFTGWSPEVSSVTKSQVYTATYSSSVNQYTATIDVNPAGYGTVTSGSVKKDWGTNISVEGNTLKIGTTTITADPTSRSDEFTYTFSGWTNNCGAKLTGDCTITANFTRTTNEYLITFKNRDGTTLKSSNVAYGTTPIAPANPSRPATAQYTYTFSGWNPSIYKVNGAQVYTAVYTSTVNNYKVTIKSNNTASGNVNPTEVIVPYGTQISTSSNILTIGDNTITTTPAENDAQYTYSFVNWTNNCGASVTTGCVITANFKSTVNQYEITFNSNSGSAVASQTKYYGEEVTKPVDPTREGYNFSGWYSDSQLTNKYNFTETVTGPLTLYAKWIAKVYTIEYNLNGGNVSSNNPTSYTIESNNITLNNPTKVGYEFKGWTGTKLNGLTMNVTIPKGSTGDRSYTANWDAKEVKITINHHLQNLDANTNTLLSTYSDYKTLTGEETADSVITLANYKLTNITGFIYDYAKVNGTQTTTTTVLADGSRVIDLYYTRNQYSFTLNSKQGATTAGSSVSKNYYYGAQITLSGDVSSDCYMWNEWNVEGVEITNNKKTTFLMPANAVIAQPYVTEKTYNIAFDGTTKTSGSMSTLNGVKCTVTRILPENGFEKTGYTFSGWATTSGGAKVYENKGEVTTLSTTNGATVTLYAVWTPNPDTPYVVNHWYLDVNGDIDNNNKQTQNLTGISDASITPDFISKDGFNNPTQKITTTIAANGSTVVNYQYTRKEYTLHFVTTGTIVDDRDVVYGGALNVDETSAISGYTFLGWSPNPEGQTMPLSGLTLTATWRANSDTPYRVEHYMERLGGGYPDSPNYIENLTGTTDTQTKAKAMNVSGFTLSGNIASYQKNINGDVDNNKTVVKVYYTRDTHTITFVKDNGETNYVVTAKYSGDVVKPADPIKTGYTFIGWDKTVPNKMPAEDMTITAQRQINQYTIHFNTNGGTEIADITLDYDTIIPHVDDPTKTGYTFAGWDKGIPERMPATGMTINANWTINSYEIRFRDSENRYEDVVYTGNYNSSTSSIKKPTWIKTGYTIHWDKEIPNPMPATGTLITALWTINQYTISFDTTGSSVADITQDYGTVINTEPQTEQYGYTFSGWYYSGQRVSFPYTMDDQNKTFVAHWNINPYTITFDANEGTSVDSITQDYNTQVTKPTDPIRTGYTFNGWYDENNTLVQWPHILTKDETFKANWTINAYTITFDANEGTPSYSYRQDYNTSISKPANPTRTGYTFTGWYDGDQKITFPYKVPATDKTLQAHWDINQYTITFVQNNGQPNIVIKQDYNSDITAPANPTKNGYTFAGWDKEIPKKMPAYNQSITANWTLNTYNISYDVKGGINNSNNPNTYTVESEKITLGDPTKTGYIFSGWIGDNGSTPEKGVVIPHGTTGNKSYIAVWDLEKYMLTYDLDGGINNPENPDEYTIETPTFTIKEPTKVGYTFLGWTGSNGTELMKIIQLAKGNYGNKKYYANWKENTYRIKYISNGGELGVNSPTSVVYDKSFTVDNPTKTGYTFSGWEITGMDNVEHTYGNDTTNSNSIASTKATSFMNLHSQQRIQLRLEIIQLQLPKQFMTEHLL